MNMTPQGHPLFVRPEGVSEFSDALPVVGWAWNEGDGGFDPVVLHASGQARVMYSDDLGDSPRFCF